MGDINRLVGGLIWMIEQIIDRGSEYLLCQTVVISQVTYGSRPDYLRSSVQERSSPKT